MADKKQFVSWQKGRSGPCFLVCLLFHSTGTVHAQEGTSLFSESSTHIPTCVRMISGLIQCHTPWPSPSQKPHLGVHKSLGGASRHKPSLLPASSLYIYHLKCSYCLLVSSITQHSGLSTSISSNFSSPVVFKVFSTCYLLDWISRKATNTIPDRFKLSLYITLLYQRMCSVRSLKWWLLWSL